MNRPLRTLCKMLPIAVVGALQTLAHLPGAGPWLELLSLGSLPLLALALAWLARRGNCSPIDLALAAYAPLWALGLWLWPGLGRLLLRYPGASLQALLLATATLPQLLGRPPFTTHFARQRAPRAVWNSDAFRSINLHLAWAWAAIFALSGIASLVPLWAGLEGWRAWLFTLGIPLLLVLGAGVPLTKRYPDYYLRRRGLPPLRPGTPQDHTGEQDSPGKGEKIMPERPLVVALNGSPHGGMGNSGQLIEMLRPVLEEQGLELEVMELAGLEIGYCIGCAQCLRGGKCWQQDDHQRVMDRLLAAAAVVLASPVYFGQVTAQMKTFIDRSLGYGHRPRGSWKPGLAISVSAGMGEIQVAEYLGGILKVAGAFPVGRLTAIATSPGAFLGEEAVRARAADLARDLARAVKEKRRYPATENDLLYYLFIGSLVQREKKFFRADYRHWQEKGLFEGFESYVQQRYSAPRHDEAMYRAWLEETIRRQRKARPAAGEKAHPKPAPADPRPPATCRELLESMPLAFDAQAAGELKAVIQFQVSGEEEFSAHLEIAGGTCRFREGEAKDPNLVIHTPASVWLGIATGQIDGQSAFMSGRYRAEGELTLLMRLSELFGRG